MVARRMLVAAVSVAVALASIGTSAGAPGSDPPSTSVYRLRGDPRMCPSPTCGGFWASRVNFKPTTCLGGTALPACYAASIDLAALAPASRARARQALTSAGTLVDGRFKRHSSAFPQLAKLVATRVWIAAGGGSGAGTVYRVVDTGIRCIRAPCFSLRATVVNGTRSLMLSGLDLAHTGATPAAMDRAREAAAHGGVLVSGTIRAVTKPGLEGPARTLAATQVWLSA